MSKITVSRKMKNNISAPVVSEEPTKLGALKDNIGFYVRMASIKLRREYQAEMHNIGLKPVQFSTLALIEANPGISQINIAATLNMERAAVLGIVDYLQDEGLVLRKKSKTDRRKQGLFLTGRGKKDFSSISQSVKEHEKKLLGKITKAEQKTLISLLSRLQEG